MTHKLNAFENGLADETVLTVANSGYSGADDLYEVFTLGSATVKVDTQVFYTDTRSAKLTVPASSAGNGRRAHIGLDLSGPTMYADCLFQIPVMDPQPGLVIMAGMGTAGLPLWSVVLRPDRKVELRNRKNQAIATSTTLWGLGGWYRVGVAASIHATTLGSNTLSAALYADPQGSITQTLTANGTDMGTQGGIMTQVSVGQLNPTRVANTMYVDWLRLGDEGAFGPPVIVGQTMHWDEQEPEGAGGFNGIMASLLTPNKYLAWSDVGGPRISYDQMATWHINGRGLYLSENHKKTAGGVIALDPEDTSREIWVCCDGFNGADPAYVESIDQGETWVHKSTQVGFNSQSPNSDHSPPLPKNPRSINKLADIDSSVAGPNGKGYRYVGEFAKGIARSIDGGVTWTTIAMPQVKNGAGDITDDWYPRWITLYPGDATKLLVGIFDGYGHAGLYRLDNVRTGTGITPVLLSPAGIGSVEEGVFDTAGILYMACYDDGIWRAPAPYTSGGWVDLDPTESKLKKSSGWNAIALKNVGAGATTLVVANHKAVNVDVNGTPNAVSSGNRYGVGYKITTAQATPTIIYVTDPGTSSFPGGGDQDINVNDISTGKRFWRADDGDNNILGRSAATVAAVVKDPFDPNVWGIEGGGGIIWKSVDDALHWQAAFTGMVIGSTMSVAVDPFRLGWFLMGNQDHDAFFTKNGGDDWTRTPPVSDFTIGFNCYCDWAGRWWLDEGDDTNPQGRLLFWDGTGTSPTWQNIGGAAAGGKTGTVNGLATNRMLASTSGLLADLTTVREVHWVENTGMWYRDGLTGSFAQGTGFPLELEDGNTRSAGHDLIWPDRSTPYLWAVKRAGSAPGLYRSANRGQTWALRLAMSAMGRQEGYVTAIDANTLYLTGADNELIRVENATGTETFRTITSFVGARTVFQEPSGRLLVYTKPTATRYASLWAVPSPGGTATTMTGDDLFDPATEAFDTRGQHLGWNVKKVVSNGQQIILALNGSSAGRGRLA